MRNRQSREMAVAYQIFFVGLKKRGFKPRMNILDNEISAEYKLAIEKNEVNFQLVPPHDHIRNISEKSI